MSTRSLATVEGPRPGASFQYGHMPLTLMGTASCPAPAPTRALVRLDTGKPTRTRGGVNRCGTDERDRCGATAGSARGGPRREQCRWGAAGQHGEVRHLPRSGWGGTTPSASPRSRGFPAPLQCCSTCWRPPATRRPPAAPRPPLTTAAPLDGSSPP